ncbi:rhomboid family intramembrane serine protease [Verrucomicrobiota bacterium]
MFVCPNCRIKLGKHKGACGIFWACPACNGRSATVSLLRRNMPRETVNTLWQTARNGGYPEKRSCPACSNKMTEVPVPGKSVIEYLDVCTSCHFVWFDAQEYESMPELESATTPEFEMPQEIREKIALQKIDQMRKDMEENKKTPDEWWKFIPAILGMPVEYDVNPLRRMSVVTWLLALIVSVISILSFDNLREIVNEFGLVPADRYKFAGLTFFSCFFLHIGFSHLVGNMYFLLIFGDNVEDLLGKVRFLLLVFTATVVGGIFHILGDPSSAIPCIGASGGISGIIAYYALKFPKARLGFLFYFRWVRMPAFLMFLLWVVLQLLGGYTQIEGASGVSYLAHLGGASVGVAFWILTRNE